MSTFILIHGAWQASWCWREVAPRLERMNHRVLAIDVPSHGKDARRRKDVQLQDYVDTDHSPLFSAPEKLASILGSIANY